MVCYHLKLMFLPLPISVQYDKIYQLSEISEPLFLSSSLPAATNDISVITAALLHSSSTIGIGSTCSLLAHRMLHTCALLPQCGWVSLFFKSEKLPLRNEDAVDTGLNTLIRRLDRMISFKSRSDFLSAYRFKAR